MKHRMRSVVFGVLGLFPVNARAAMQAPLEGSVVAMQNVDTGAPQSRAAGADRSAGVPASNVPGSTVPRSHASASKHEKRALEREYVDRHLDLYLEREKGRVLVLVGSLMAIPTAGLAAASLGVAYGPNSGRYDLGLFIGLAAASIVTFTAGLATVTAGAIIRRRVTQEARVSLGFAHVPGGGGLSLSGRF